VRPSSAWRLASLFWWVLRTPFLNTFSVSRIPSTPLCYYPGSICLESPCPANLFHATKDPPWGFRVTGCLISRGDELQWVSVALILKRFFFLKLCKSAQSVPTLKPHQLTIVFLRTACVYSLSNIPWNQRWKKCELTSRDVRRCRNIRT
jgi:hypothetical protein